MRSHVVKLSCLIAILMLSFGSGLAEVINDDPDAVSLYARGKRMLREGNWLEASKVFEELSGRFPQSDNVDFFLFNQAKANFYLGDYDKAIAGFSFFVRRFESSHDVAYAYFFRGNAYYRNGQITRALGSYIDGYLRSSEERLDRLLLASLEGAFTNASAIGLTPTDFRKLPEEKKCRLMKMLAEIYGRRGELRRAQEFLDECDLSLDLESLSDEKIGKNRSMFEIAVLLPFSGELHSFAEEIYNGVVIGAEQFRNETGKQMSLTPYDTKGDPIDAARIVSELSRSISTDAAIGPLTSEASAVASAALSCSSLPLLVPAATQAGLTRLSESSFQLSPNIELQGIRMAEYAVADLLADSAAVITSTSPEHLRMARAFSERFQQLGGTILAIEYYRPRDTDFGKLIRDMKSMLLGYHSDSTYFVNPEGDTLDPDELPARLDCLFLPGDPSSLRQLIPQINFYNMSAAYLGSDGWGDEVVLRLGDKVTRGAVFPSPFLAVGSSQEYFDFAVLYDARYGNQPTRLANLGYDAIRLICAAIKQGRASRDLITERLAANRDYEGASGRISFGKNRENIDMPLYRVELEQAIPLREVVPTTIDSVSADSGE